VTAGLAVPRMADDLAQMLDALAIREPIALCGLSMGLCRLAIRPRYRERLAKLIVCDTKVVGTRPKRR
jgi:pimeloyl-ACP methyl ester carboxylesterase